VSVLLVSVGCLRLEQHTDSNAKFQTRWLFQNVISWLQAMDSDIQFQSHDNDSISWLQAMDSDIQFQSHDNDSISWLQAMDSHIQF
jgi:hypothetical protein